MKKNATILFICLQAILGAHCQMPCGIYHDEIEFGRLDEYVELMTKAMKELETNEQKSPQDRANFVRWVNLKDSNSNEMAALMMQYFLQQRIKSDETELLIQAHKVLVTMMQIEQLVDSRVVDTLKQELKAFKELYMQKRSLLR